MSSASELAELHRLVGDLRRCVMELKTRFSDAPGMRRVVLDTERLLSDLELLDIDANELDLDRWMSTQTQDKIAVPDTEYDAEFWRDVDDEGIGGYGRS